MSGDASSPAHGASPGEWQEISGIDLKPVDPSKNTVQYGTIDLINLGLVETEQIPILEKTEGLRPPLASKCLLWVGKLRAVHDQSHRQPL